ncbi:MAG: cysteine synthase family protein [archaeon]
MNTIGNTPLVNISYFSSNPDVQIFAKLESFNPSGSCKDRVALAMVEKAEKYNELKKGAKIIEPTSGNTGIALAFVSAVKGYEFTAVMPKSMSPERKQMIEAFGGKVILADGGESEIIKCATELSEKGYFMPNQFENYANVEVAYKKLGKEIVEQVKDIDIFVAGIGTGGTITGVGKKLKEVNPNTRVIGFYSPDEKVQGTINVKNFKPKILNIDIIDDLIPAEETTSITMMKKLWQKGLFVGMSSGATLNIAVEESKKMKCGKIVVMFADSGNRYLSIKG